MAAVGFTWTPARAQTTGTDTREEIVVTATRTETPASKVGSSISVITADDLAKRQVVLVEDVLREIPGVAVTQTGGPGGVTSVFLRGGESSHTLVLIDGMEVNDSAGTGGAFNFNTLTADDIQRIEVLRGAQSTLYGSRALGGVINIITNRGRKGFRINGLAEYGSFSSGRGRLGLSGGSDRLTYSVTASGYSTDGISAADKRNGNSEKDGLDTYTLSGNFGARLNAHVLAQGQVRYVDSNNDFDAFDFTFGVTDANNVAKSKEVTASGSLTVTLLDGHIEGIFRGGRWSLDRNSFEDRALTFTALGKRREFGFQGNVYINKNNTLTLGTEFENTNMNTGSFSPLFGNSLTQGQAGIDSYFAQYQTTLLDRLNLTAGVRHDDHSTFGGATTFHFSGALEIPETGTTIRASYGEGFKAPSLFRLFSSFGNPDLQPERNTTWDVGAEQYLLDDRMTFKATYFDADTTNLITFSFATFAFANEEATRARGVELELRGQLIDGFEIIANYTLTSTRDKITGARLLRRPRNVASLELSYAPTGPFQGSIAITYTGKKPDTRGPLPNYTLVKLRGSYRLSGHVHLFARVENLLDKTYQEVFGFGAPGIAAYGGLKAQY